jgi:hypothetical protein
MFPLRCDTCLKFQDNDIDKEERGGEHFVVQTISSNSHLKSVHHIKCFEQYLLAVHKEEEKKRGEDAREGEEQDRQVSIPVPKSLQELIIYHTLGFGYFGKNDPISLEKYIQIGMTYPLLTNLTKNNNLPTMIRFCSDPLFKLDYLPTFKCTRENVVHLLNEELKRKSGGTRDTRGNGEKKKKPKQRLKKLLLQKGLNPAMLELPPDALLLLFTQEEIRGETSYGKKNFVTKSKKNTSSSSSLSPQENMIFINTSPWLKELIGKNTQRLSDDDDDDDANDDTAEDSNSD